MKEFDLLLEVADKLLAPDGCPWDRKQTFFTLQPYVLEEAHEVIEAVDKNEEEKIIEELGDLLYTVVFYAKLAQKENRFSMKEIIETITEKLIRRHPHVFAGLCVENVEQVVHNWEQIKKKEGKTGGADELPPTLPVLVKAQKIIKKMIRCQAPFPVSQEQKKPLNESEIGEALFQLIAEAEKGGIDAESALRRTLERYREQFAAWGNEPR